jgi:hypothetical protein
MGAWIVAALVAAAATYCWHRWQQLARAEFIRSYTFPHGLFDKVRTRRPQLDAKQMQLVARGLRQFFLAYLHGGRRNVSMPSQVADDLWHEFILYTRQYDAFCRRAFGGFLHHTPAIALSRAGRKDQHNAGLRRVWWHTCKDENINPRAATRLPLLFALDAKLGIADGFVYTPDCKSHRSQEGAAEASGGVVYCGGDFSDGSFDGSTEGLGDSSFGDAGADGGSGCGGDGGCGGGCGGD